LKYTERWISKCWLVLYDGKEIAIDEENLEMLVSGAGTTSEVGDPVLPAHPSE